MNWPYMVLSELGGGGDPITFFFITRQVLTIER